jgi:LPXTG-motif cell wall-anchored protein
MARRGSTRRARIGMAHGAVLTAAGVLLAAAGLTLGGTPAGAVEYGNPAFLGRLSAQAPTGFPVSPAWIDLGHGPVNVTVGVSVANLTDGAQSVPVQFSVHRIMSFQGQNISDGQPGQPGLNFPAGTAQQTVQVLYGSRQNKTFAVPAGQKGRTTLSFSATISTCGYYQIDFSTPKPPYVYLASGFTRALGCEPSSTTTTSTTVMPTTVTTIVPTTVTTARPAPPTTSARVLALTSTAPVAQLPLTGSSPILFVLAGLLVAAGLSLLLLANSRRQDASI